MRERAKAGQRRIAWLMRGAALVSLGALAGCGSDGGGGVNSTPTPAAVTPTPSPTPTPTPVPTTTPSPAPTASSYDTSEYRATVGAVSMNALAAYNAGATGAGVTLAVIDSGIDTTSAEFTGRISSASQNVAGGSGIADADGHGTAVGFAAAGRRNGSGSQGVAFDATLLVLRADTPGTCAGGTASTTSTCSFNDDNIARGVDVARTSGARVINISLGGDAAASSTLIAAIDRATAAGIVVVVAAGNSGNANPDGSAQFANNDAIARNLVIVAGSVGANANRTAGADALSSFSNRAGNTAAHYLAAVGESVRAPDQTGTVYLWSGTSFSTPQISGAVALLAQAFPKLTGAQIVSILYQSARDAGVAGVDTTFGEGVLDLTRAFQPLGTTTVAGSALAVSTTRNGQLSTAMGDATMHPLGAVIIDGYSRAFTLDLARTIAHATPAPVLGPALATRSHTVALAQGGMTAAVTLAPRGAGDWAITPTALTSRDALAARVVAGSVTQKLGARLTMGFAFRQDSGALAAQLGGVASPAFLVARDDGLGFDTAARAASAMRGEVAGFGLTAASEAGDVLSRRDALIAGKGMWRRDGYARTSLVVDRRLGALALSAGIARLDERGTLLGAHFDPSLGATRAASWLADVRARWQPGGGWSLGGTLHQGWSYAAVGGAISGGGVLRTAAFAADIGKAGVLGAGDALAVRVASPPRVVRGGVDLMLPTGWDYDTGAVSAWTTQRMDLVPGGHELDLEAHYARPWLGGLVDTNLFWRRDPGNIAALPPDYGLALRYAVGF